MPCPYPSSAGFLPFVIFGGHTLHCTAGSALNNSLLFWRHHLIPGKKSQLDHALPTVLPFQSQGRFPFKCPLDVLYILYKLCTVAHDYLPDLPMCQVTAGSIVFYTKARAKEWKIRAWVTSYGVGWGWGSIFLGCLVVGMFVLGEETSSLAGNEGREQDGWSKPRRI